MFGRIAGVLTLVLLFAGGAIWSANLQETAGTVEKKDTDQAVIAPQPPIRQTVAQSTKQRGSQIRTVSDQTLPSSAPAVFSPRPQSPLTDTKIDEIIARYLPDASDTDRAIWREQFEGLESHEVEFILQQRVPLPRSITGEDSSADPPPPELIIGPTGPDAKSTGAAVAVAAESGIARLRSAVADNVRNARQVGYCRWQVELDPVSRDEHYRIDFSVGQILTTNESLDIAESGGALFKVTVDDTDYFTRNGSFRFDKGRVVTAYSIDGQPGVLITGLPESIASLKIAESGDVRVITQLGEPAQQVGTIQSYSFLQRTLLKRHGNAPGVFVASAASGPAVPVSSQQILQGALMLSNSQDVEAERMQRNKIEADLMGND